MGFRIANNIASMNVQRQLSITDSNMSKALERLSSGYRINSAADDSAGLALSQTFRADIASFKVASRNATEANALLQVAEGAMDQIGNMLVRLKELATQAASANAGENRAQIDAEKTKILAEMNRIANVTEYAGAALLDGTYGGMTGELAGIDATNTTSYGVNSDYSQKFTFTDAIGVKDEAGGTYAMTAAATNTTSYGVNSDYSQKFTFTDAIGVKDEAGGTYGAAAATSTNSYAVNSDMSQKFTFTDVGNTMYVQDLAIVAGNTTVSYLNETTDLYTFNEGSGTNTVTMTFSGANRNVTEGNTYTFSSTATTLTITDSEGFSESETAFGNNSVVFADLGIKFEVAGGDVTTVLAGGTVDKVMSGLSGTSWSADGSVDISSMTTLTVTANTATAITLTDQDSNTYDGVVSGNQAVFSTLGLTLDLVAGDYYESANDLVGFQLTQGTATATSTSTITITSSKTDLTAGTYSIDKVGTSTVSIGNGSFTEYAAVSGTSTTVTFTELGITMVGAADLTTTVLGNDSLVVADTGITTTSTTIGSDTTTGTYTITDTGGNLKLLHSGGTSQTLANAAITGTTVDFTDLGIQLALGADYVADSSLNGLTLTASAVTGYLGVADITITSTNTGLTTGTYTISKVGASTVSIGNGTTTEEGVITANAVTFDALGITLTGSNATTFTAGMLETDTFVVSNTGITTTSTTTGSDTTTGTYTITDTGGNLKLLHSGGTSQTLANAAITGTTVDFTDLGIQLALGADYVADSSLNGLTLTASAVTGYLGVADITITSTNTGLTTGTYTISKVGASTVSIGNGTTTEEGVITANAVTFDALGITLTGATTATFTAGMLETDTFKISNTGITAISSSDSTATGTYTIAHSGNDITVSGTSDQAETGSAGTATSPVVVDFDQLGIKISLGSEYIEGGLDNLAFEVTQDNVQTFQIGTANNDNHQIDVSLSNVTTGSSGLNVSDISFLTASGALGALDTIDSAITSHSTARGNIGAYMNRLSYASANLATTIQNIQAAESIIRDADMAEEMTAFTKNQILMQAGTAMLSQANMAPQMVLSLFG